MAFLPIHRYWWLPICRYCRYSLDSIHRKRGGLGFKIIGSNHTPTKWPFSHKYMCCKYMKPAPYIGRANIECNLWYTNTCVNCDFHYLTRQLPMGAGHCQWGWFADRNVCGHISKIMSIGPLAEAGEVVTDGHTHGHTERITNHYYGWWYIINHPCQTNHNNTVTWIKWTFYL